MLPDPFKCWLENVKLEYNDKNDRMESPEGVKIYTKYFGS
jgi:hypothetical protein